MKLGATDVVDALADDAAKQILELTKGGVDHAIEAVGRPASASLAAASLRRGGTATILGMMPPSEKVGLSAMDLLSGKKLRPEEHTSELQSLMRISYAVFCLKKPKLLSTYASTPTKRSQYT